MKQHIEMPCPDDAQIEYVESMIAVITDDIRERRRAATKIESCFRGIRSRDQSAGETFKLLVKQKLFVERITIAVEAKLKHEAQEKVMAKQKAWEKHNKKLIGNKLEPISLVKYKRLLDCKKRGVDYNSEDYSSSTKIQWRKMKTQMMKLNLQVILNQKLLRHMYFICIYSYIIIK